MEDVAKTLDQDGDNVGNNLCVRLRGEDREGMEERTREDWSKIVRPKDEELERIARSIKSQYKNDKQVFVNFNNHFEGLGPLTIEKF
jgi:uncharacterized protein YecE (DUF72 family)